MEFSKNPHCSKPFLAKDNSNWYIQFWYRFDGKRLPKKYAFTLNNNEYRSKVKGKFIETEKVKRKKYADAYLEQVTNSLKNDYFNPITKLFESVDEADKPFVYYIEKYLVNPYVTHESSTLKTYKSYFKVFNEYLADKNLSTISLKQVDKALVNNYLMKFNAVHSNGNLRFLKAVFNYCVDDLEILTKSPIKNIKKQDEEDSDSNKPYSLAEFVKLLEVAKTIDNEFYILLLMQYYTLRRPTEILKLQFKDFDFNENTIYFSGKIAKSNKRQTASIPEFLMDLIKMQLPEDVEPHHHFLGSTKGENGWHNLKIFNIEPITIGYFQDKFKRKDIKKIIKSGQTLYSVKHSGVIHLKEEGYSNSEIMGLTGHASEGTLGVYAREHKAKRIIRKDNLLIK